MSYSILFGADLGVAGLVAAAAGAAMHAVLTGHRVTGPHVPLLLGAAAGLPHAQRGAGESCVVAFLADNPGIWLDHCHDLQHAADGFVMHLAYEGVSTPYAVGNDTPSRPE